MLSALRLLLDEPCQIGRDLRGEMRFEIALQDEFA